MLKRLSPYNAAMTKRFSSANVHQLSHDVSAGLLVALVGLPQCLAYAMLAGLPPMYGLSTAIVAGAFAALLGKSHRITVGPTNTTGLIVLASLAPFALSPDLLLPAMAVLTILAGAWRLVIVWARAERIFNFIPEAVMLGFATGAALLIAWMQVDDLLGQPAQGVRTAVAQAHALYLLDWRHLDLIGVTLGVCSLVAVMLGKRWLPRWPIALLVLVTATSAAALLPEALQQGIVFLGSAATISDGWPQGAWPSLDLDLWLQLLMPALAIAMIGSLELIVTLRANREMPLLSNELRAQGFANLAAAFAASFPASASLTRSALLKLGNAQTRLAPMLAALLLLPVLLFGAHWVQQIPLGVIAGLLVATAWSMLDQPSIATLWRANRQTRGLFVITLVATLALPFHYAILLGVALSIALFLHQTSRADLRWFACMNDELLPWPSADVSSDHLDTVYVQVSGSLYFAAAKSLPEQVIDGLHPTCKHLLIDVNHAHQLRYSALLALREIVDYGMDNGIDVSIGRDAPGLLELSHRFNIDLPLADWTLERRIRWESLKD
ncbi:SulP family inorganic anion transporter [Salinispirillum sp. LH 10-3-1]|uniref:SulP family inorganic anion transporter n=1 Tax=Salinispirillum sp. LH 10-3-1 TaxID=2952525 RepID=A0AB38YBN5_9GAMM